MSARRDAAFVMAEFCYSERLACKLVAVDRSSYRYDPRPDRNGELREALITLARHGRHPTGTARRVQWIAQRCSRARVRYAARHTRCAPPCR